MNQSVSQGRYWRGGAEQVLIEAATRDCNTPTFRERRVHQRSLCVTFLCTTALLRAHHRIRFVCARHCGDLADRPAEPKRMPLTPPNAHPRMKWPCGRASAANIMHA